MDVDWKQTDLAKNNLSSQNRFTIIFDGNAKK